MWEAAGYYDMEDREYELGSAEMSEEDLEFQNTKRAPDQDDMVVNLYVEAEKAVGIAVSQGTMTSLGQTLMLSVVVGGAAYAFGVFRGKAKDESYVSLVEMNVEQN